jgi:hypothetical protein
MLMVLTVILLPHILLHSSIKIPVASEPALASIVAVHVPSVGVAVWPPTVEGLHVDIGVGGAYYATPCY